MLTVIQQIEEIRIAISKHLKERLLFEPLEWKHLLENRNCFTYAFNIKSGIIEKEYLEIAGSLIGSPWTTGDISLNTIYKLFIDTLIICGITFKESYFEEEVPFGWYKVAMCISSKDIHWLRQDDDGTWSHKQGWYNEPTNIDLNGMPILNPSEAKIEIKGSLLDIKYLLIFRNY
jgi:hypothetical protein